MKNLTSRLLILSLTTLLASCQDSGKAGSPAASSDAEFICSSHSHTLAVGSQSVGDLVCEGSGSEQSLVSITPAGSGLSVSFSGEEIIITSSASSPIGTYLVKVNNRGAINEMSVEVIANQISCAAPTGLPNLSPAFYDVSALCSHAEGDPLSYELVAGQNFAPLSVSMLDGELEISGLGSASIQVKVESVFSQGTESKIITIPINLTGMN